MFMVIELSSHVMFPSLQFSSLCRHYKNNTSIVVSQYRAHYSHSQRRETLEPCVLLPTFPVHDTIPLPQQSSNRATRTEPAAAVNMATEVAATSTASEVPMAAETVPEKPVILIGVDDSEHSYYALEWILDHFFAPHTPNFSFELVVVHAKPSPVSATGLVGPVGVGTVVAQVDTELKIEANRVQEKAKQMCISKSIRHAKMVIWEGDARNVLCEAADKFHASMLVIGSHRYGVIKRAVLGSVSDYCAHHAHCSVMIVKKPKPH